MSIASVPGRARVSGVACLLLLFSALAGRAQEGAPAVPGTEVEETDAAETDAAKTEAAKTEAADDDVAPPEGTPEDVATGGEPATSAPADLADFGTVAALEGGSGVRVQSICTNCNQANLTVNGVTGDAHVPVTFDGVPTAGGLGTVYVLNQFPGELVGYSHVVRGPGTVQSGSGGMGGLLEFHSAPRTGERKSYLRGEIGDWGTKGLKLAGAERWGPVGALAFLQGIKQSTVDANGDGANEMGSFERLTTHGIVDIHLTDRHVLSLNALFYGENQVAGPGKPVRRENRFDDEDVNFNWRQFGLSWEWDGGDGSSIRLDTSYSRRKQAQFTILHFPYLTVEDVKHFARVEGKIPIGTAGMLTSAAGLRRTEAKVFNDGAFLQRYVDDGLQQWELYTQYDRNLGAQWDFSAGLRYDDMTVFGKTRTWDYEPWIEDPDQPRGYLLPRAQVHWRPHEKVLVGLSTGRFAVGPTPVFEKTCCGAQFSRSIELVPERAWSHQAQVELHPTQDMRVTATLFQSDFTDYILRLPLTSSQGIPEYTNINVPRARVRGLDLVHDMRFKDDMFNVGWTYTRVSPEDGEGSDLPYLSRNAASSYFRFNEVRRGIKASFDVRWIGAVRHYQLSDENAPSLPPVGYRESDAYVSADARYEQRIGRKGWAVETGISNITDYVMSDLDRVNRNGANSSGDEIDDIYERSFDWGPITGRYVFAGFRFSR
jgi:outer membrane receptor protein involved in Fe transport